MKVETLLVKAFTQNPDHGNPAGVVIDASQLTETQMLAIATKLGFSESAFVLPSEQAAFQVRFFTPTQEVPLCGHGTIATFYSLVQAGLIAFGDQSSVMSSQETSAGVLPVVCHRDGLVVMEQATPTFFPTIFDAAEVAKLLGISSSDLVASLPIQLVSTGSPKLLIPVQSLAVLEKIRPDLTGMKAVCADSEVRGFYPFTTETKEGGDFQARQFNPYAGINEDPVTGVAAGALGAYAISHRLVTKTKLIIEQGYFLNKGGKMYVTIEGDKVTVGGYAVVFDRRQIDVVT